MTTPKVFIISATTGNPQFLDNLKSVQKQTYGNLEHVVVVDGHQYTEKVTEMVKSLGDQKVPITQINIPWNTGRDRYICHKIYASIPQLIHKPAYVNFLDEDNFIEPEHIESMVKTIVDKNYFWCHCLRNVVQPSGEFICRDMCESLGNLSHTWINPNDFLVDTNCYLINVEAMQHLSHSFQRQARTNPEADRLLFRNLNKHFKHSGCSMKYTLNYRVEGRGDSVKGEFFVQGNKMMNARYNNSIPWDCTPTP